MLNGVDLAVPLQSSKSHQWTILVIDSFVPISRSAAINSEQLAAEQLVYEPILLALICDRGLLDLLRHFAVLLLHET